MAAADYNKDGRLDVFYDFFFTNVDGQLLLRNQTGSGHWLSLSLGRALGGGIGAKVSVYRAGGLGTPEPLSASGRSLRPTATRPGCPTRRTSDWGEYGGGRKSEASSGLGGGLPPTVSSTSRNVPAIVTCACLMVAG